MKILCCGSRTWSNKKIINKILSNWESHWDINYDIPINHNVIIIHGNAEGADKLSAEVAKELGYTIESYPADWNTYGKAAGPIRNQLMIEQKPDLVIAFWDGISRGTADMLNKATKAKVNIQIYFSKII
jgi:predicted phosphodiesterase